MSALTDFVIRLLSDLIQMPLIFIENVLLSDPLSAAIVAVGSVFIVASVGVFGYVALGALGLPLPGLGRGPGKQVD